MDPGADAKAALVGGVHFLSSVDVEGQVFDADVVLVVLAAICRAEAEQLIAIAKVDNLFGAAVTRIAVCFVQA